MASQYDAPRLPVIDLSLFDAGDPWRDHVAAQIDWAAGTFGAFYIVGHGIDAALSEALLESGRHFFAQEYRGKQSRHFDPEMPGFRDAMQDYSAGLTGLSHKLMATMARGLGLGDSYFVDRYTGSPTVLFRIFNYPAAVAGSTTAQWGTSAHTDSGLLTLLKQDTSGGFQIEHRDRWLDVPEVPDSFVVKVGDTLERLTGGRYVSAAHRVVEDSSRARLLMPFFFDPGFDAELEPIPGLQGVDRPHPTRGASGTDLHHHRSRV
jgi:isopenicillin N synthase-like dioxygenase